MDSVTKFLKALKIYDDLIILRIHMRYRLILTALGILGSIVLSLPIQAQNDSFVSFSIMNPTLHNPAWVGNDRMAHVALQVRSQADVNYDIIAFFSPSGIQSLLKNFPDFKQNNTRIAAFGPTTAKAVTDAGLLLDIQAPHPNAPSMTGALELYIKKAN